MKRDHDQPHVGHDDHDHADTPAAAPTASCGPCCGESPQLVPAADSPVSTGLRFRVPAMDCASEESEVRRAVEGIAGIRSLTFRLGERSLRIDASPDVAEQAAASIRRTGFEIHPWPQATTPGGESAATADDDHGHDHDHAPGAGFARPVIALALATGAEALSFLSPDTTLFKGLGMAIAAAAIAFAGIDVFKKGASALLHGRLNINALMAVAVAGAFVIGQWPEAAMVMALYAIAELIESKAVDRARNAISGLLAMAPEDANIRQADGAWLATPVATVPVGATARIRPGERVPLDGIVTEGTSAIDQAPVTGESIPVDKGVGDPVFAGTINQSGTLTFKVTAAASNSTLARIIHAVEQAQGSRAPTQRFVDRFAAVYTPAVFVLALAVALLGPWVLGWAWLTAIYKALVLLVIACPCALVISTPVTVVSGLAAGARRGILIKGGIHLEQASLLKAIALDKTGTITEGKPKLVEWHALSAEVDAVLAEHIAAALTAQSDHPVSRAIAAGLKPNGVEVKNFTALPGRGVQAEIDGAVYVLGNHRLIEDRGQCSPALEATLSTYEKAGRTVSLLASDAGPLAVFAVADTIKPTSRQAIAELAAMGIVPVMLTGDNQATAEAIGRDAGLTEVRGNLLPEDKLAAIQSMQARYGATAMTGDGINDAPALAQADIGVAMGAAGTDIAMEAADVVVMNDDLRRIAETVRLSRKTHAVLWQNITLALGIKAVFFVLAVFGSATMWMAVFADMGASLLVVFNGLRLLRSTERG
ncbi:heavy metal translocating P-type ATPase [Methylibium sp.]|uniref:heavy metal translocating P-type ATPase n=1 Tax=Methylibium sp. TaxID=2067992 RepID=UPI003D0BF3E9